MIGDGCRVYENALEAQLLEGSTASASRAVATNVLKKNLQAANVDPKLAALCGRIVVTHLKSPTRQLLG